VWILDTQNGILNHYLGIRIPWLSSTSWSLLGVSIASIWWDVGLAFILFLAALKDVDPEVLAAARIDGGGATPVAPLHHAPAASPVAQFNHHAAVDLVSEDLQPGPPDDGWGPAGSSISVMNYVVDFGIQRFKFGYAAAIALMLFALILLVTLVQRWLIREAGYVAMRRWLRGMGMQPLDIPLWIFGMLASVVWVAPFMWMVSTSVKPANQIVSPRVEWLPRTIVWDHYVEVFKHPALQWAANSVIVTSVTTAFGVLSAAMPRYALARLHFPGRGLLFLLLMAAITLLSVPSLAVFILLQRYFIEGVTRSGIQG
jgi:ABC-type glycerol-3-phosphate transport system permease component